MDRKVFDQISRKMRAVRWHHLSRLVSLACWAYVGIILVWLAVWVSTGETLLLTRLAIPFSYWIGLSLVFSAGCSLWQRQWLLTIVSAGVGLLLLGPYVPQYFPRAAPPESGTQTFTVMTYNTMGLNQDVDAISRVILNEKPDILFLQESYQIDALMDRLGTLYDGQPVYLATEQSMGLSTVSRFPLTRLPALRGIQKVSVHTECDELQAWVLRAPKVNGGMESQYRFFETLADDMRKYDGPILAAGDFNMTERSVPYGYLRRFLKNAHEDVGYGLGATFPAPGRRLGRLLPPMIRIDHIFYNEHITAYDSVVLNHAGGSDHYPVKAHIALANSDCRPQ